MVITNRDIQNLKAGDLLVIRNDSTDLDIYFVLDFGGDYFMYSKKTGEDEHEMICLDESMQEFLVMRFCNKSIRQNMKMISRASNDVKS